MRRLLLRWTWRDLRGRWPVVVAISLVVAFGVGVFAALNSTTAWRRESNDASFALTRMHDVRVQLTQSSFVPQGSLAQVIAGSGVAARVVAMEERLVLPTQVALESSTGPVFLPGELVGAGAGAPLPVDAVWLSKGRPVDPTAATPEAILEYKVADDRGLPPAGTLQLSGGGELGYVGTGTSPEYFLLTTGGGGEFLASRSFAPVYTTLATAQQVSGHPGMVNDAVLRLAPGTNTDDAVASITAALGAEMPDLAVTVSDRLATDSYRKLYDDIKTDQRLWDIISALTLASASFAAFNLVTRMVESQRREIGIAMALGMRRRAIARRPLMAAGQIVVLGGIAGIGVGWLIGLIIASLLHSLAPLPVSKSGLQLDVYAQALVVGVAVPLAATLYPVLRAVRMQPVDALTTGHRAVHRRSGHWLTSRIRLPGRSLAQMPLRNLLRAPRRTLLTASAIAGGICVLIAIFGMLDSFQHLVDRGRAEVTRESPDRLQVEMSSYLPVQSAALRAITGNPTVGRAELGLHVPGTIRRGAATAATLDVVTELIDFQNAIWRPSLEDVHGDVRDGIVLSRKAASDLGVRPGDTVIVRHPQLSGATSFVWVETPMQVVALHPNPLRFLSYLDIGHDAQYGLSGVRNTAQVLPAAGGSQRDVQAALFSLPGVASVQPASAAVDAFDDALRDYTSILEVTGSVIFVLTLLIAFNSTTIGIEERTREQATMFAFGVRLRTVLRLTILENLGVGILASGLGLAAGYLMLGWIMKQQVPEILPELGVQTYLAPVTIVVAIGMGTLAVSLTPFLSIRRFRRMDIPSALRVAE